MDSAGWANPVWADSFPAAQDNLSNQHGFIFTRLSPFTIVVGLSDRQPLWPRVPLQLGGGYWWSAFVLAELAVFAISFALLSKLFKLVVRARFGFFLQLAFR